MFVPTLNKRIITAAAVATLLVVILTLSLHQPTYQALRYHTGLDHEEYDTHGFLTGSGTPIIRPATIHTMRRSTPT
jgi:hypothetical protein